MRVKYLGVAQPRVFAIVEGDAQLVKDVGKGLLLTGFGFSIFLAKLPESFDRDEVFRHLR